MKLRITKTNVIENEEQWRQYAPPMDSEKQWKENRSAQSLARFATDKNKVKVLEKVFKELGYSCRGEISCTPEANTPLPGKGNGRNHDLLMIGQDFVVGIEAKVTERFGKKIQQELKGSSGNKKYRADSLVKELFNCDINEDIEDLRYQLLTGTMGTLFEAIRNNKSKALFLVIVFTDGIRTHKDEKDLDSNNSDYVDFCKKLGLGENGGTKKVLNIDLTIKKIYVSLDDLNPTHI